MRTVACRLHTVAAVVLALLVALLTCVGAAAWAADGQAATAGNIHGTVSTIGQGGDAITVLKLWGTPYEMGYAHGKLCADKVQGFYQRIITAMTVGMKVDPKILDIAWAQMEPFVADRYKEEMKGLADGAGVSLQMVQRAHAIPDLSEFHCSFFAAWGDATPDGKLHQIRALDYETQAGIQDEPALMVCMPEGLNAFVQVGWVGFIGALSGMSAEKIALSEIGEHFSDDVETLAGEPMPLLMRRVLEEADTLGQALDIFNSASRTSSYLYCVSDAKIPDARKLRTSKDFCEAFGPAPQEDMGLANVVYWSMGTGGSDFEKKWNNNLYETLKAKLGKIDQTVGMQDVMKGLGTGNLHAVHFAVTDLELWVANATPAPANAPAYTQEFVHFSLAEALK